MRMSAFLARCNRELMVMVVAVPGMMLVIMPMIVLVTIIMFVLWTGARQP